MPVSSYQEELGLCEGDLVKYLPTEQIGSINRIWSNDDQERFELKLMSPDKKIWVEDRTEVELLCPVG